MHRKRASRTALQWTGGTAKQLMLSVVDISITHRRGGYFHQGGTMTPPNTKPPQTPVDPLQFALSLLQPAPLLVQKDAPALPITGKVELDKNGSPSFTVMVDLSFLLGAAGAGRAASGLGKALTAKGASAAARSVAAENRLGPTQSFELKAISDGIAHGLKSYFGTAPRWLIDLADLIGL